jgi:hypothetical protein
MKVLLLGLVFCAVLFVAGFVAPKRSRRLQKGMDRILRKGERKSDRSAGRLGDWTEASLEKVRRVGDKSAEAGRSVRKKLPP